MNQQLNSSLADNTHCKAKKFPDMNLFPEQFDQEDLLSSILKEVSPLIFNLGAAFF